MNRRQVAIMAEDGQVGAGKLGAVAIFVASVGKLAIFAGQPSPRPWADEN